MKHVLLIPLGWAERKGIEVVVVEATFLNDEKVERKEFWAFSFDDTPLGTVKKFREEYPEAAITMQGSFELPELAFTPLPLRYASDLFDKH